jgi:hypothetical protein
MKAGQWGYPIERNILGAGRIAEAANRIFNRYEP